MTITTSGGLVRLSGDVGMAANDDLVSGSAVVDDPRSEGAEGWDPYEVWRTRVKLARDDRDQPRGGKTSR